MNLKSAIESILFVSGDPVPIKKLASSFALNYEEIKKYLDELSEDCKERGVKIIINNNAAQIVSSPENSSYVQEFIKKDLREELSQAAIETLAIIAYRGPISRAQIEEIRGVNSSFTIRNLLIRGLIEREENSKDLRGYLYNISFDFMRLIGVENISNLPKYEELKEKNIIIEKQQVSSSDREDGKLNQNSNV